MNGAQQNDGVVNVRLNQSDVAVSAGQSVAAVLTCQGITAWRETRRNAKPRGLFCGIGVCYDCLVTVDGQPNQRACMVEATEGMQIEGEFKA